ncbi:DUF1302 family protein [Marinobacter sp. CHS3-4]|uniref:DUF1302 family protein n=1 Tax=Marinobacter sp. CHS3-4 TaxID=3045174 RepID=UPI0024B510D6|nr:DUF1302 family protein [Marinobacter sp. CHS3-4]MDI9245328.1 hypothetical protein [Marinobacter sp. CHS3-4]
MKRFTQVIALVNLIGIGPFASAMDLEHASLVSFESAYTHESGTWQKQELIWRPEWTARFNSGARLTLLGEARMDAEDNLDPGQPRQPFRAGLTRKNFPDDRIDLELRELYLDHYLADTYLRVGKQQIVWGQADGLRVLDVINPLSYREFILPDIEHRRIPLWSALAEIPVEEWTAQIVWIPDATVTESPLPGASYSVIPDPFGKGRLTVDRPESLEQSDVGFRLSSFQKGWDLTLNYLYHTIDDPLIRFDSAERRVLASYNRSHLIGATASKPFGSMTLRSEIGVETEKRFFDTASGNVIESEVASYVLGLDFSGFADWFISGQLFQTHRFNHLSGTERSSEMVTLLLRRDAFNNALQLEALSIYDVDVKDSLIQLEAEYTAATNVVIRAGSDLFFGERSGTFGQFRDESRITAGFTLSF